MWKLAGMNKGGKFFWIWSGISWSQPWFTIQLRNRDYTDYLRKFIGLYEWDRNLVWGFYKLIVTCMSAWGHAAIQDVWWSGAWWIKERAGTGDSWIKTPSIAKPRLKISMWYIYTYYLSGRDNTILYALSRTLKLINAEARGLQCNMPTLYISGCGLYTSCVTIFCMHCFIAPSLVILSNLHGEGEPMCSHHGTSLL